MKTTIFFTAVFLIGCSSIPDPLIVFDNNYYDFILLKDKLAENDLIYSFRFKNKYSYVIDVRSYGRIKIDEKNKKYQITDSDPEREILYHSREELFLDIGEDPEIVSSYLLFFEKYHNSFNYIGKQERTISIHEIYQGSHLSAELMANYERENSFLKKMDKTVMTYKFIRFGENIGFTIFDGIYIYYSPDIDLSELSQDELLIFGFKWIKETSYENWYEIAY
jgi:hypothetical protein